MHPSKQHSDRLPFAIDFRAAASMTDQVVAGLRHAIRAGVYRNEMKLPSFTDMAAQLDVSLIVIRRAVARLTEEGLLRPRQGYGVVVTSPDAPCRKGTVLFVTSDHKAIYFTHFIIETLRRQLSEQGYLLSHVVLTRNGSGNYQFDQIDQAMLMSVRLAVVYEADTTVLRHLDERGVPYVAHGRLPRGAGSACVGCFGMDYGPALAALVRQARAAGVKTVLAVSLPRGQLLSSAVRAFGRAGIACRRHLVEPLPGLPRPESVQRAVMQDFLSPRGPLAGTLPDLVFFADDYIAAGALTAMLARGMRIPEDVCVVSFANVGLGPVFVRGVSRLAVDAREIGMSFASAVLDYLRTSAFPARLAWPVKYVADESFPGPAVLDTNSAYSV